MTQGRNLHTSAAAELASLSGTTGKGRSRPQAARLPNVRPRDARVPARAVICKPLKPVLQEKTRSPELQNNQPRARAPAALQSLPPPPWSTYLKRAPTQQLR